MRIAGAFVGRARRVAGEHRSRLPAGEAHQVTLGTAAGQPVMRERVPELVRVKLGKPDLATPVLDHLVDAARRESTLLAEPQPRDRPRAGARHGRGCTGQCRARPWSRWAGPSHVGPSR